MLRIFLILSLLFFTKQYFGQTVQLIASSTTIYNDTVADKKPEFIGGKDSLSKFLDRNTKYPKTDLYFEGEVDVEFRVERNGKITNAKIKKGIYQLFDDEALRVVRSMPNWRPAEYKGTAIPTTQTIPVKFSRK